MIELGRWSRRAAFPPKPWLILGKGPSFSRHGEFDLGAYNLLGLNHVVRELKVDVAHAIDVEVAVACADALRTNCRWLVMPSRPHVENWPTDRLLEDFFDKVPVLRELDEQGRLVCYELRLGHCERPDGERPVIGARFFSSEAALNVLAAIGAKTVRSLGIDGGRGYSSSFRDLEGTTMLSNTHGSFDVQFAEIDGIAKRNEIDYAPLVEPERSDEPMRVFVGADESQLVAAAVLEHSIRKHASRPVEFTAMLDLEVPEPRDAKNKPRTGFSFYRFVIPRLCNYHGRALYLDCDMQVFADIDELWQIPFNDATVLCTHQPESPEQWRDNPSFKPGRHLAVMLLDCSRLHWDVDEIVRGLDEGRYTYEQLMSNLCIVPDEEIAERIPVEWNSLEQYEPGKTKLIHYTVVPTQPWKNDRNLFVDLWMTGLREALQDGAVGPDVVRRSVAAGHVKGSLVAELDAAPPAEQKVSKEAQRGRSWVTRLLGSQNQP